jgi:hypothetical protein
MKLTSQCLNLDDEAGGKAGFTPPPGCASRPGSRARANRLRHLLTICRGVSRRAAMISLDRPSSARRMILAPHHITIRGRISSRDRFQLLMVLAGKNYVEWPFLGIRGQNL